MPRTRALPVRKRFRSPGDGARWGKWPKLWRASPSPAHYANGTSSVSKGRRKYAKTDCEADSDRQQRGEALPQARQENGNTLGHDNHATPSPRMLRPDVTQHGTAKEDCRHSEYPVRDAIPDFTPPRIKTEEPPDTRTSTQRGHVREPLAFPRPCVFPSKLLLREFPPALRASDDLTTGAKQVIVAAWTPPMLRERVGFTPTVRIWGLHERTCCTGPGAPTAPGANVASIAATLRSLSGCIRAPPVGAHSSCVCSCKSAAGLVVEVHKPLTPGRSSLPGEFCYVQVAVADPQQTSLERIIAVRLCLSTSAVTPVVVIATWPEFEPKGIVR